MRFTITEQMMIQKQGVFTHPDTDYANRYEDALEDIEHSPPGQAKKLAEDALNNPRHGKKPKR